LRCPAIDFSFWCFSRYSLFYLIPLSRKLGPLYIMSLIFFDVYSNFKYILDKINTINFSIFHIIEDISLLSCVFLSFFLSVNKFPKLVSKLLINRFVLLSLIIYAIIFLFQEVFSTEFIRYTDLPLHFNYFLNNSITAPIWDDEAYFIFDIFIITLSLIILLYTLYMIERSFIKAVFSKLNWLLLLFYIMTAWFLVAISPYIMPIQRFAGGGASDLTVPDLIIESNANQLKDMNLNQSYIFTVTLKSKDSRTPLTHLAGYTAGNAMPLQTLLGNHNTLCADARLDLTSFDYSPTQAGEYSLDQGSIKWSWNVTPKKTGNYNLLADIEISGKSHCNNGLSKQDEIITGPFPLENNIRNLVVVHDPNDNNFSKIFEFFLSIQGLVTGLLVIFIGWICKQIWNKWFNETRLQNNQAKVQSNNHVYAQSNNQTNIRSNNKVNAQPSKQADTLPYQPRNLQQNNQNKQRNAKKNQKSSKGGIGGRGRH
jgi:hypothetical protein